MFGQYFIRISTDDMKKAELYRYIYDFAFDYDNIGVNFILDIDKYLIKKTIWFCNRLW